MFRSLLSAAIIFLSPSLNAKPPDFLNANPAEFNAKNYSTTGNIHVFEDLPNFAWLIGEIQAEDYYHLRKVLREHNIQVLVLDSPGGNVYESLQMAAVVHDRKIDTYIPLNVTCASACANIFFAGNSRFNNGLLGVHQFKSVDDDMDEEGVQLTVSDIISFLNEFDTHPIVYEKMFYSQEMHYFSKDDFEIIDRLKRDAPAFFAPIVVERHISDIYRELDLPNYQELGLQNLTPKFDEDAFERWINSID